MNLQRGALDGRRDQVQALITSFRGDLSVTALCELFDMLTSTYYEREQKSHCIDVSRLQDQALVTELFTASQGSAGSLTPVQAEKQLNQLSGNT